MKKNYPHFNFFYFLVCLFFSISSFSQYCTSYGNNSTVDEYLGQVQFNTINKISGDGTTRTGYSDFTAISTNLTLGETYTLTITPGWTGTTYPEGYAIWIDYNKDEFFDAGERIGWLDPSRAVSVSGLITIPTWALTGNTRMRVSMKYNGVPTACEKFSYGEVEDYTVNIVAPCTNPDAPAVTPNTATSICNGASINLNATSAGNTIFWFTQAAGGTSIGTSASGANFSVSPTSNTTYYAEARTATGGCISASRRATALVMVNAPIGNNTFNFTTGNFATVWATVGETNPTPSYATLTAPAGKYFMFVGFASYGTPTDTYPNFAIGSCHSITSQSVTEGYLLGNNTATIPATNDKFGDPCIGTVKRLYVQASHTAPICWGTSPSTITGLKPTGGNGTFTYLWESSTTSATSVFASAAGANSGIDYTPGALTQTTWFRRTVYSGGCSHTSSVILMKVTPAIVNNSINAAQTICSGATPSSLTGTLPTGGNGAYTYLWESSITSAIAGFGTVSGTSNLQNYTPGALTKTTWFRRTVTSGSCSAPSTAIQLTVNPLPAITTQPSTPATTCSGSGSQTMTVVATGTGLTYQWRKGGVPLTNGGVNSGATSAILTLTNPTSANAGSYDVIVSGTCAPAITSTARTVTVKALPVISGEGAVCVGSTITLTPTTGGTWTSNNIAIATITNAGVVTGVSAGTTTFTFTATATGCSKTSTSVTVKALPVISGEGAVCVGSTITLSPTTGGTWSSNNIAIATITNGGVVTGVSAGTTTFTFTATATGCSKTSTTVTVNPFPLAPTTTGAQICIGSTATLSASGAGAGSVYKWYSAATGGSPLYTSTNNTDNTYVTPIIAATTNYWVSILNLGGCESARTSVTATFPAVSLDSQFTAGTNTWIGHVYDGTNKSILYNDNFTNYYGTHTEPETFDENFGGDKNCFSINSTSLGSRSIYTETFSVRYRMNSTRKGLYVVDLGSDDGSRLSVDGTLVYNNWSDQPYTLKPRVLMSLTGNSKLVYDFYEAGGANRVNFNNLILILENKLSTNTSQNICPSKLGDAISGDTYGIALPAGISLSGTGYQWTYSTTLGGTRNIISGATGAIFKPNASIAPFNSPGTYYVYRNAMVSSVNNISPSPYVATNESNVATVVINGVNTWNGSSDKNWNNPLNWCVGVPISTSPYTLDVVIPEGLTNYPIIYAGANPGYVKNILFENNTTLNVQENCLKVTGILTLNGKIDLEGESQLVQTDGSTFDATSTGYIEIDQQGTANSFNYNYWSSPVGKQQGAANNAPYTLADVLRDGTNPANPKPINFGDGAYFADTPNGTDPIKITSRWIWTYNAVTNGTDWDNYYQWKNVGYWDSINVGDGFSMKGTGGVPAIEGATQNYVFVGKPNNGTILLGLAKDQTYLIGNPYPSALDADEFIKDNIKETFNTIEGTKIGRDTVNVFNGALYFWDHFGSSNNHLLAGYEAGYATYNLMGGVVAIADVPLTANKNTSGSKVPERYIPVGQGFFVDAILDPLLEGTTTTIDGGTLVFKNSQRVFKREAVTTNNSGSVFMKTAMSKKSETQEATADARAKVRLQFDSPMGYRRPLLVGVDENASNQFDIGYDAPLNEENQEDMFWQLGKGKLVIQGVNNFNKDQELPLGLKISKAGLATIKIEKLENMDENLILFIKDKFTGKTHNISQNPFEIALEPGEYLDRFSLVFKTFKLVENNVATGVLIVEPLIEDKNYHVYMNNTLAELQIKNNGTDEIRSVALYNYLGQSMKIWKTDLNRRIISLPVKLATGVYIVQINTINNAINKKIIIE